MKLINEYGKGSSRILLKLQNEYVVASSRTLLKLRTKSKHHFHATQLAMHIHRITQQQKIKQTHRQQEVAKRLLYTSTRQQPRESNT